MIIRVQSDTQFTLILISVLNGHYCFVLSWPCTVQHCLPDEVSRKLSKRIESWTPLVSAHYYMQPQGGIHDMCFRAFDRPARY